MLAAPLPFPFLPPSQLASPTPPTLQQHRQKMRPSSVTIPRGEPPTGGPHAQVPLWKMAATRSVERRNLATHPHSKMRENKQRNKKNGESDGGNHQGPPFEGHPSSDQRRRRTSHAARHRRQIEGPHRHSGRPTTITLDMGHRLAGQATKREEDSLQKTIASFSVTAASRTSQVGTESTKS